MSTTGEQRPGDPGPHLDTEGWRALRAREPWAVAHFARHLATPCEACEAFLAEAPEAPALEALEALADEALLGLAGTEAAAAEDALGWERVRRRAFPARRAWVPAVAGALVALAATLVLLVAPGSWREAGRGESTGAAGDTPSERWKGLPPVTLELTAVAQLPDGSVRPVSQGEVLPEGAVVLLRYHVSEAADALLLQEAQGAPAELLGRFRLEPGTHDLRADGGLAGVSLEGEQGPLALVLVALPVASGAGASEERLEQAASQPEAARSRLLLRVLPRDNPR